MKIAATQKLEVCIYGSAKELQDLGHSFANFHDFEVRSNGEARSYPIQLHAIKFIASETSGNLMMVEIRDKVLVMTGNKDMADKWGGSLVDFPDELGYHIHIDEHDGMLMAPCGISLVIGIEPHYPFKK